MKKILPAAFAAVLTAVSITFAGCEKLEIPVITDANIVETETAVVQATAVMTSRQIDACGVVYSKKNSNPTLTGKDSIVYGELESDGTFSSTLTLEAGTTYWFMFFATNEMGTATSEIIKVTTGLFTPRQEDNPLPNP